MQSAQLNVRTLLFALAIVTACWGPAETCAAEDRAQRYYDDAQARYDKGDFDGAVVQLKNALQSAPGMLAAHVLLGKTQLSLGQPEAAEEAFEKALSLGVHPSEVAVPMAQALLHEGRAKDLLSRYPADSVPSSLRAEVLVLRGHAYKQLGDLDSASRSFQDAHAASPSFMPAIRSEAELLLQQRRSAEATKLVARRSNLIA